MRRAAALLVALGLVAGGCGLGAGEGSSGVSLTVTRDFGARTLGSLPAREVAGEETVMRLLQRSFAVRTRYGGGFVQSIDGLAGGRERGRPVDWFYYVNGIEADRGATSTPLRDGDRVWWDRHPWRATQRIPAVVGSYPEPFVSGAGGRRLPVRLDCEREAETACDEVRGRLEAAGVPTSRAQLGAPSGVGVLRVLVGRWERVRRDGAAAGIERGPAQSGVFARFARDGRALLVLDPDGRVARVLGAGTGLVAATRYEEQQPTWVVTGTDDAGVMAAARALEEGALADHFALAISRDRAVPVPAR